MPIYASRRRMLELALALTSALGVASFPALGTVAQGAAFACPAPAEGAPSTGVATPEAPVSPAAQFPKGGGDLTVFAAASLTDAYETIKTDLEASHEGLIITYNFAGSQALVTQMTEGAEADVFASANDTQMEAAVEADLIAGDPVTFVRNRLAIVTPADNPAGIAAPEDLGKAGVRLVLAQAEVPVGRYARDSICLMGQETADFGDDFVERVAANLVSEEEDVRNVLAKVQLGEADAGIVYVSDAKVGGDDVNLIEIPVGLNVIATYPIATVNGSDEARGDAFIAYLLSDEGQATLEEFGFEPVS